MNENTLKRTLDSPLDGLSKWLKISLGTKDSTQ